MVGTDFFVLKSGFFEVVGLLNLEVPGFIIEYIIFINEINIDKITLI